MANIVTNFELKQYLPDATQKEIDRIQAIAAGNRNDSEADFLENLAPYLTNELLLADTVNNLILIAAGNTLPTSYTGFKAGAIFIKKDTSNLYINSADHTGATFIDVSAIPTSEIADLAVTTAKINDLAVTTGKLAAGAVTAAKLAAAIDMTGIVLSNLDLENGTPVNAAAAGDTLTLTGAIIPGVHAENVVTATTILDGNTCTIGSTVYRFKTTMLQAYDVALGANDSAALDNLKAAINGTGTAGVNYFAGTVAHPNVVATTKTSNTLKAVARVPGTAANSISTTGTAVTVVWSATTLGAGTGSSVAGVTPETVTMDSVVYSFVTALSETNGAAAIAYQVLFGSNSTSALANLKLAVILGATIGTNYSTGTLVHPTITAVSSDATTFVVAFKTKGVIGNGTTVSETLSNGGWGTSTLASGVDGTVTAVKKVMIDSSYLYYATAANTISTTNWRRVTLGSAF